MPLRAQIGAVDLNCTPATPTLSEASGGDVTAHRDRRSGRRRGDRDRRRRGVAGSAGRQAPDVAPRRDDVVELHVAGEAGGSFGRVVLQPDPVDLEVGVAAPAEALERRAAGTLREDAAGPGAVGESRAEVADLDAVEPDRMLAVRGRDRVIELDHVLDASPLPGGPAHLGLFRSKLPQ